MSLGKSSAIKIIGTYVLAAFVSYCAGGLWIMVFGPRGSLAFPIYVKFAPQAIAGGPLFLMLAEPGSDPLLVWALYGLLPLWLICSCVLPPLRRLSLSVHAAMGLLWYLSATILLLQEFHR